MKQRSGFAVAMATLAITAPAFTQNQTDTISPIVAGGVPFRVEMELVDWVGDDLPAIHSAAYATLGDQLLLVGGKTSGLHNFTCDPDVNWPAADFNGTLMVVDFETRDTFTRPLADAASGLTPNQIASLSSSNPLSHQSGERLVCIGGYGVDDQGDYVTFSTLRVLDVAGVIDWVRGDRTQLTDHIRFHEAPKGAPPDFFTICGGVLIALCLVGMPVELDRRELIERYLSVGYVSVLMIPILIGRIAATQVVLEGVESRKQGLYDLVTGLAVGILGGVSLSLLIVALDSWDLRDPLVNWSPKLFRFLTYENGIGFGLMAWIVTCGLLGMMGAASGFAASSSNRRMLLV